MKIVMLERDNVGKDVDISAFHSLGELTEYAATTALQAGERIKDAEIIIVNKLPMNEATLKDAGQVRLICETATGVDNIDLEYTRARGITVTNVKGYSTAVVAQHTFALYFYLAEQLRHYDDYVRSGAYAGHDRFSYFGAPFHELNQKTWGIIGLGAIGRKVAEAAAVFGCRVLYFSATGRTYDVPYERADFDQILCEADVLSVHAPLTEKTKNLMNQEAFRKMKEGAIFINVGRGPIVNEGDLARALEEGWIAGAGLDVLSREPIAPDNPLNRILGSSKLIITPHMAWASVEARKRLMDEVYENIAAFLRNEKRGVV